MEVTKTPIKDLYILEPRVFNDDRGYFFESFNENKLREAGLNYNFVQDNQSLSSKGTIRGLHLQTGEHAQAKLVRVTFGKVLDVAVDLRKNSETFGKTFEIELSAENNKQLLIPRGFAHGFSVLSEQAVFQYKVDNFYNKDSESGIIYNDPDLNIDWQVGKDHIALSEKDLELPSFEEFKRKM